jgi:hypothetical protein
MKMKKYAKLSILLVLVSLTFGMLIVPQTAKAGVNAAGTAGTWGDMPVEIDEDNFLTLVLEDLTANAEFIITATTGSGVSNITFSTNGGQDSLRFTRQVARPSGGTVVFSLYGYTTSTGVNATLLDTYLVSLKPSSDYNADILTNFIGLFVTGGIIVSIVVLFRKKVL